MGKTMTEVVRESNKRRLKSFSFLLPPDLVAAFKEKAAQEGRSQRSIVIELVEKYIQ